MDDKLICEKVSDRKVFLKVGIKNYNGTYNSYSHLVLEQKRRYFHIYITCYSGGEFFVEDIERLVCFENAWILFNELIEKYNK